VRQELMDVDTSAWEQALLRNLDWFEQSGIMDPADGRWGVAERILLTDANAALDRIAGSFTCYTPHDGYRVLEHRRPDCNCETALLFLLSGTYFHKERYSEVGRNILRYLVYRSGTRYTAGPLCGLWQWASPGWPTCWVDDNAWVATLSFIINRIDRRIGDELDLLTVGVSTINALKTLLAGYLDDPAHYRVASVDGLRPDPHFLGLAAMALGRAYLETGDEDGRHLVHAYLDLLAKHNTEITLSNHAYLAMTLACCAAAFDDERMATVATASGDRLISRMGAGGVIPSEHDESPIGENLADLIYTENWAALALQNLACLTHNDTYRSAFLRTMHLLTTIQDTSPAHHLHGCWRGMYDMSTGTWGGGDAFEGGAGSIYSGWTNAPIALALLFELTGNSLLSVGMPAGVPVICPD
jgi:hypothetical protein